MTVPSKNFSAPTDGQVDPDSPVDTTLLTQIRDALVHLEEWLGDGYTAAKDHDHDGTNSALITSVANGAITPEKMGPGGSGYTGLIWNLPTQRAYAAGDRDTWKLFKSQEVYRGGVYLVQFTAKREGDDMSYAQIFVNDVAAGTLWTVSDIDYEVRSEEILVPYLGDVQLKMKIGAGSGTDIVYCKDFKGYLKPYHTLTIFDGNPA